MYAGLLPNLTYLSSATWIPVTLSPTVGWLVPDWLRYDGPRPSLTPDSAVQVHAATAVDVAVGFTLLFLLYLIGARLARGRSTRLGASVVFGVAVLFQILAVLAPFGFSGDLFSYAIYGRIFSVYGGSPYLEAPIRYPNDPFYSYVYWMHVPSFYGPLWTLISGWIGQLAGDDVGLAVLLFRLVEAVSVMLAAILVFLYLRREDPNRALVGALLLSWCPLVVVESGLSAHNDVLMGLLIVIGLVLAARRRPLFSIAAVGAVVLAGLVKVTALALLPLLGIYLLRSARSWLAQIGIVLGSAAVAAGLTAAIVWPVWSGLETFAVGTLGSGPDRYVNSPAEAALGEIRVRLGASRDDLEVPLQFSGWWVGAHTETLLYASRGGDETLASLPVWNDLLVVGPEREKRLRVFDPVTRQVGYVDSWTLGPIDPPAQYADDPEIQARLRGPVGAPDLIEANRQIRLFGWAAFAAALLLAVLVRTSTLGAVVAAWVGLCLVLVYLTLTWFWPWYVLWGLMPAALAPRSMLTRLTVYVAWGVMLAYALLGFQDSQFWYLNNYRAVPMFGLPLVLFAADEALRLVVWLGKLTVRKLRRSGPLEPETRSDSNPMSARLRGISGTIQGPNP